MNSQLSTDKAAVERHAVEQYYENARRLHDSEREQETLERVVQFLETEQASIAVRRMVYCYGYLLTVLPRQSKHDTALHRLERDNDELRQQIAEQSALLIAQRNASSVRVSQIEDELQASREAATLLQRQLIEQANEQARIQEALHEQLCTVQSQFEETLQRLQDENASLQRQLLDQQTEHTHQRDALLDRISLATADQSEVKVRGHHHDVLPISH